MKQRCRVVQRGGGGGTSCNADMHTPICLLRMRKIGQFLFAQKAHMTQEHSVSVDVCFQKADSF